MRSQKFQPESFMGNCVIKFREITCNKSFKLLKNVLIVVDYLSSETLLVSR